MHWPRLFAAPHRGLFAIGTLQGLLAMTFWVVDLGGRYGGFWPLPAWPLPSPWIHALLLIHGVFGSFIFGFILTAGPRWQQQPDVAPGDFRPLVLVQGVGWLLADLGLAWAWLLPVGLLVAAAGWLLGNRCVWRLFLDSPGDRRHIGLVAAALSAGSLGLLGFAAAAAGGPPGLVALAITLGLWLFLVPVFTVVMHRMLPFFSQSVIKDFPRRRPVGPLWLILAGSAGHGALQATDAVAYTWLGDLPAAAAGFYLSWLWRLPASFGARILAVLHVGFAWLPVAFSLLAAHSLLQLAGAGGLGLAPLHALTLGCFSSLMVGMASRVTLGHAGLPIVGDRVMWASFWAMQAATLLRLGGDFLWPMLNPLAATIWLGAFLLWALRYGPAYWRPRADGEPG